MPKLMELVRSVFSIWLKQPVSIGLALFGIAVTLSLPMLLHTIMVNLGDALHGWSERPGIVLYLETTTSETDANKLIDVISVNPAVAQISFIDKQQGLDSLLKGGAVSVLQENIESNPLPHVIIVNPVIDLPKTEFDKLSESLSPLPGVHEIQVDYEWMEQIQAVTGLTYRIVFVFWSLLLFGIAMIISNTVRFMISTSEDEIHIISLVGGTWNYIRRPFLLNGALLGSVGSCLAFILFGLCVLYLKPALGDLIFVYQSHFVATFVPVVMLVSTVILATTVGGLAAWFTTTRFLKNLSSRM